MDNENVRNTLIEYISTSVVTFPPVYHRAANAELPIKSIPLCVVSRSDKLENQWGTQESSAMLANTRGPSMKPACAATTRRAPSENIVSRTNAVTANGGAPVSRIKASVSVWFMVSFSDQEIFSSKYETISP